MSIRISRTISTIAAILLVGIFAQLVAADSDLEPPSAWQQRRQTPMLDNTRHAPLHATAGLDENTAVKRLREGTLLAQETAVFTISGDRIMVQLAQYPEPLRVLENLALERVWKMIDESRGRQWSVSGMITEYRGQNFLLLSRAVLRSRLPAVSPRP